MAYIIKQGGEVIETSPKNKVEFSLDELRSGIGGGFIELVRCRMDFGGMKHLDSTMVVDEEGMLKNFEQNLKASLIAGQYIVGDVMLISNSEIS